jgi:hypothetical protein
MLMGFEGQVYIGAAGQTAATLVTNRVDAKEETKQTKAPATVSGDGTKRPIECEQVASIGFSFTLTMKNIPGDGIVSQLRASSATGEPVALRTKDNKNGKGYDGDVNVDASLGMPVGGEETLDFTLTPNNINRVPQLYV